MAKRKQEKKIHKDVPKKSRLRDLADDLWAKAVKADWNGKCAVCGKPACDSHHLSPRANAATRYDLLNGMALCYSHHRTCPKQSPHQNPAGFMEWLLFNNPERHHWLITNKHKPFDGVKNDWWYVAQIQSLRPYFEPVDFEAIVGTKFSQWLEEQE